MKAKNRLFTLLLTGILALNSITSVYSFSDASEELLSDEMFFEADEDLSAPAAAQENLIADDEALPDDLEYDGINGELFYEEEADGDFLDSFDELITTDDADFLETVEESFDYDAPDTFPETAGAVESETELSDDGEGTSLILADDELSPAI